MCTLCFVADGPANCSSTSIVPECQITTNTQSSSEAQVLISLSAIGSLMCVVRYLIQFNGENRTVPVNSPSAEFPVTITQGNTSDIEVVVYTLDYENRTGQMPCILIAGESSQYVYCVACRVS